MSKYLREAEAGEHVGYAAVTMSRWRRAGIGPPYVQAPTGAIRYAVDDLDRWMEAHRVVPSGDESAGQEVGSSPSSSTTPIGRRTRVRRGR